MPKSKINTKLLFTIFWVWWGVPVFGQLKYDALTTSNGLSQGYIYDILQDSDGFLWFATKDGLNRYDGYNFKVFTYDIHDPHSISYNNINQLFEDSKGRLWVSTDNGINIYDKSNNNFRKILNDPNNANSLSGNKITVPIVELPDGRFLAMSDEKGLNVISLPDDFMVKSTPPTIFHINIPLGKDQPHLYKDGRGKVWLMVASSLYEFDTRSLTLAFRKKDVFFHHTLLNEDGNLWTNDVFFSEIQDTVLYPLFNKDIVKGHGNFSLYDKSNGRFWVGITDSAKLEIYNIKRWKRGSPLDPDQSRLMQFSGITPTKIYKDRSGLVWLGTNGYGIRKYLNDGELFHLIANGLSVRKIYPLQNNQFYVRGWDELKKFDTDGKNLTTSSEKVIFVNFELFGGKDNTLWTLRKNLGDTTDIQSKIVECTNLATKKVKTYKIQINKTFELDEPKMEDSNGNIWITGFGGNFIVLNPKNGDHQKLSITTDAANPMLKSASITALYEDAKGIFWMGTETGLVKFTYNPTSSLKAKVTWYRANTSNKAALNYNNVSCILDDAFDKNILWVATKGGGLNRLNKTTNQFTHITTKEGLCNNVVYGILPDEAGNIWGSTNRGIFCLLNKPKVELGKWMFRHFTKVSGLQDDEFNTGAFAKLNNGDLAFGGVNGLNIFNPATVLQNGFTPNVFITNILVGNEMVLPNDKTGILKQTIEFTPSITLNHLQDILTLEFSSLDFMAPHQNKYRYQLVGIDKSWVESGTRRNATYLHLPAGNYVFKVQASNSQGVWSNKIKELQIRVMPPWWRTWWAYIIYLLFIGFAVHAYFKFRLNKAKLQSQLHFEQQEAKRVKELDTVKTQLYANITHEFRTPLTVILGMAQQVKAKPEEHLGRGMDMIIRNGNHLLNLVNEMLDLSKLEDGKMTLHLVNGDVINFLRYVVESFQSLATSQQKQFHFLSDTDELTVAYDAEKLRQIITNLLSNALKFTPAKGNVYVSISQEETKDADYVIMVLKVKDTGIGIPENQVQHIFDRFYQLDNSHTRKAEGTGIGLALTKELVKLMSGTIAVKSPPVGATRGTEFIITLRLTKVRNGVIEYLPNAPANGTGVVAPLQTLATEYAGDNTTKNKNIPLLLLVEDNVDVVAYTASCLPDFKLSVGKDGQEGFDIAVEIIPDLIITDVMMPFIDGFEMCRKLRDDERTSHIPIIMLTAKADIQSKLEGLEQGADVYLEKPFHKEELLLRIRKLIELRKNLQQYYSKQIGIIADTETIIAPGQQAIEEGKEHEFVIKVREIVEANFTNYEFSVEQLCKQVFMSHSQLHRKLEALTNCSPNKFIKLVRLQKAKTLLANPALPIGVIALDCGYIDPGYFARVFKQEYGITPQEWRAVK